MNKFVSPTTGATISSAQFGILLALLAFLFANHFNIVGMGKDFSQNLGVPYNFVLFLGLTIAAMITASVVVVVGSISYIGLIVPNLVAMFKGDKIRGTLIDTALFGALFVLVCDIVGRMVIFPCTLCTAHRHSFILFLFQHPEYPYPRDGPQ